MMGFKRYGVDHFISGTNMNSKNLKNNGFFKSLSDNEYSCIDYEKNKNLVKEELKKLTKKDDVSEYEPYDVTYKKLDLRNCELRDNGKGQAYGFIQGFVNNLMYQKGKLHIDRKYYTEKMQNAVSNIVEFIFKDPNFKSITLDCYDTLIAKSPSLFLKLIGNVKVYSKSSNPFKVAWQLLTGSKELSYSLDFTDSVRKKLATDVTGILMDQKSIVKLLDDYYPTKAKGAKTDIYNVLYEGLSGSNSLDTYITAAFNLKDIIKNHSTLQELAWLHLEDSWYCPQTK